MNKRIFTIPQNVTYTITNLTNKVNSDIVVQKLSFKGPLGVQHMFIPGDAQLSAFKKGTTNNLKVNYTLKEIGILSSQINKMIQGVTTGYFKQVKLFGVGYKFNIENNILSMSIGFSNPVEITNVPGSVKLSPIEKKDPNILKAFSTSLEDLNNFVYNIQRIRPVSRSFKGTGISVL